MTKAMPVEWRSRVRQWAKELEWRRRARRDAATPERRVSSHWLLGLGSLATLLGWLTLVSFGGALMVLGGALLAWSAALLPTGVRIGLGLFGVWSVAFGAVLISAWSL